MVEAGVLTQEKADELKLIISKLTGLQNNDLLMLIASMGSSPLNAFVSTEAFIQPPQAFADNAAEAAWYIGFMGSGGSADADFSNKGITYFTFTVREGIDLQVTESADWNLSGNKLTSQNVIDLFSQWRIAAEDSGVTTSGLYLYGPEMGTPLVGGVNSDIDWLEANGHHGSYTDEDGNQVIF
jgi:hypothetical protein